GWGGVVWGLLAFKPVWAMSFFLVLVLTGRWRFGLAMLAVGALLGLATLPFVGLSSWFVWLAVGREAWHLYGIEENWILLSRDLLSIPRRYLTDFKAPLEERDVAWLKPTLLGWGMLVAILEVTVRLAVVRQSRAADGPATAFLFLGAWLCCYH